MINLKHEFYSKYELEELERASMNLPDRIVFRTQSENTTNNNYGIFVFPHNIEEGLFTREEHLLYNQNKTLYGKTEYIPRFQKETVSLNFNKIPIEYQFLEVYKFHHSSGEDLDFFVAEEDENGKVLFGYSMTNIHNFPVNIFIGTFAQTDTNNWKFYPKMEETKFTQLEIMEKYYFEYQ